ncbi:hypothetical protein [Klebsiella pneumoniae]|uniref:hypothetical protein n=1 Tax=Klebsiella pneumoniae TaxID=573 RepID=UPI000D1A07D0|nr:hypothetical protein [Klebsiella pneumoniae]
MNYRTPESTIKIKGTIPKVFFWITAPYPFLFTQAEIFYATWMTWFHYRNREHWARGIYFLTDRVCPTNRISVDKTLDFETMIHDVFNRVNDKEEELSALFESMGQIPGYYQVRDFRINQDEFEIILEER